MRVDCKKEMKNSEEKTQKRKERMKKKESTEISRGDDR